MQPGRQGPALRGAQVRQVTAHPVEGGHRGDLRRQTHHQHIWALSVSVPDAFSWDLPVPPRKTQVDMGLLCSAAASPMWWLFLAEGTLMVAADMGHRGSDVPRQGPEQKGQVGAWLAMLSRSFQQRGAHRFWTESRHRHPRAGLSSAWRVVTSLFDPRDPSFASLAQKLRDP